MEVINEVLHLEFLLVPHHCIKEKRSSENATANHILDSRINAELPELEMDALI